MAAPHKMYATIAFVVPFGLSWLFCGKSDGDDTYIYMTYVRNFLATGAFTFNPAEASAGITSFLWPLAMIPVSALFGTDAGIKRRIRAGPATR